MVMDALNELFGAVEELMKLPYEESVRLAVEKLLGVNIARAFEESNRILCVAPHPDDCELGAGGTIASLSRSGKEVYIVVATDGGLGTYDPEMHPSQLAEIRRKEQLEAARLMGVKQVYWLGYRDGFMPYDAEARSRLITLFRLLKPDVVLAPDPWLPYEAHPDHRHTGLLAAEAALVSGLPHFNEEDLRAGLKPWSTRFIAFYYTHRPNYYHDITETIEVKLEALKAHRSQFTSNWSYWEFYVKFTAALNGRAINTEYAEAFKILPTVLLHVAPFAEVF
jgi:LmbE family N-acetylglucosaminyl deacetylase